MSATSAANARPFGPCVPHVRALAINEDNNDKQSFASLKNGKTRLCYASPECLLRNEDFKRLFRDEVFRSHLVAILVDEAHAIAQWAALFRKDYGELAQLRVVTGTEVPWGLFSATLPSEPFDLCFKSVRLGETRPFWGLDLGSNRVNLAQWVRPMEYPRRSFAALFAFLPSSLAKSEDLPKSIFYFATRRDARVACGVLRRLLPPNLAECMRPYTAVFSEYYKETIMERFRSGSVRWLFRTDAAGMGCDIPDITMSVIYGVQDLCSAFQKGGRAARRADLTGRMIWPAEGWVFEDDAPSSSQGLAQSQDESKPIPSQTATLNQRRQKLDPAARTYITRSQSDRCMRAYATEYFHPRPGFVGLERELDYDAGEEVAVVEGRAWPAAWEVAGAGGKPSAGACCSARCCRVDTATPIALLTSSDRDRVATMLSKLHPARAASQALPLKAEDEDNITLSPSRRCSQAERSSLDDILHNWRDQYWHSIAKDNPFLPWRWVLDDESISVLVSKAHKLVNAASIDTALIRSLIPWISDPDTMSSLPAVLHDFRAAFRERSDKQRKKASTTHSKRDESPTPASRRSQPAAGDMKSQVPADLMHRYASLFCTTFIHMLTTWC